MSFITYGSDVGYTDIGKRRGITGGWVYFLRSTSRPNQIPLLANHCTLFVDPRASYTVTVFRLTVYYRLFTAHIMPNVMAALPNIGGALCSTPQSLADAHYYTVPCSNAAKTRNRLKFAGVPQTAGPISAAIVSRSSPYCGTCGGGIAV